MVTYLIPPVLLSVIIRAESVGWNLPSGAVIVLLGVTWPRAVCGRPAGTAACGFADHGVMPLPD